MKFRKNLEIVSKKEFDSEPEKYLKTKIKSHKFSQ